MLTILIFMVVCLWLSFHRRVREMHILGMTRTQNTKSSASGSCNSWVFGATSLYAKLRFKIIKWILLYILSQKWYCICKSTMLGWSWFRLWNFGEKILCVCCKIFRPSHSSNVFPSAYLFCIYHSQVGRTYNIRQISQWIRAEMVICLGDFYLRKAKVPF